MGNQAVRIYPAAIAAIKEIWRYTDREWGEEQANVYVRGLYQAIEDAGRNKTVWREVEHASFRDVFFIRYEHHYLFFRELGAGRLGLISVLHENMDLPNRLREDLEGER